MLARLLAREVAYALADDPGLLDRARELAQDSTGDYADHWREVLDAGLAPTLAVLRSTYERTQPILTDNPLTAIVDEERRQELVDEAYGPTES